MRRCAEIARQSAPRTAWIALREPRIRPRAGCWTRVRMTREPPRVEWHPTITEGSMNRPPRASVTMPRRLNAAAVQACPAAAIDPAPAGPRSREHGREVTGATRDVEGCDPGRRSGATTMTSGSHRLQCIAQRYNGVSIATATAARRCRDGARGPMPCTCGNAPAGRGADMQYASWGRTAVVLVASTTATEHRSSCARHRHPRAQLQRRSAVTGPCVEEMSGRSRRDRRHTARAATKIARRIHAFVANSVLWSGDAATPLHSKAIVRTHPALHVPGPFPSRWLVTNCATAHAQTRPSFWHGSFYLQRGDEARDEENRVGRR
jgi:hypothetical protein